VTLVVNRWLHDTLCKKQITASERNSELEHATGINRSIYLFNYLLFVYLFIVCLLYLTLLLNDEQY
jgi:hypothetical protein